MIESIAGRVLIEETLNPGNHSPCEFADKTFPSMSKIR